MPTEIIEGEEALEEFRRFVAADPEAYFAEQPVRHRARRRAPFAPAVTRARRWLRRNLPDIALLLAWAAIVTVAAVVVAGVLAWSATAIR